jgi:hypothetical protein
MTIGGNLSSVRLGWKRTPNTQGENIMNFRLVQFSLGPGKRSVAEAIADEVVPAIRAQQGCDRCEFFADYEAGDYGIVVLWASKQAAEAAASVISPILTPLLVEAKKTAESRRLFDIYEPK